MESSKGMVAQIEAKGVFGAAAGDTDMSLLDWSLSLSPRERLRACSNAARALRKFKRAETENR